jgi:hypothetical protein
LTNSNEIARNEEGETKTVVWVSLNENYYGVRLAANDVGDAPKKFWGHDEYEYCVDVPKSEFGRLLVFLLKEKYIGNIGAVEDFRVFCKKNNIAHEFWNA